jgi:hypothetical protein
MQIGDVVEVVLEYSASVEDVIAWRRVSPVWTRAVTNTLTFLNGRQGTAVALHNIIRLQQHYRDCEPKVIGKVVVACLLNRLTALNIEGVRTVTSFASSIARAPHLRNLNLSCSSVSSDDLASIAKSPKLETLVVKYCPALVSFAQLAAAPSLRFLVASRLNLRNEGLAGLCDIAMLTTLDLSDCPHVSSIEALRGAPKLESLVMVSSRLTNGGLMALSSLPRLTNVDLSHSQVFTSVEGLCSSASIEILKLTQTPVTDAGVLPLASLSSLRELNIQGCHDVRRPEELGSLISHLKTFRRDYRSVM